MNRSQTPLVLYCYGRDCIRSRECATIAARHGFLNLLWYREGMDGWEREARQGDTRTDIAKSRATAEIYNALEGFRSKKKPSP